MSSADLVTRIVAYNDAWHALRALAADGDPQEPSLAALADLKALLQVRLLTSEHADLVVDPNPNLPEACFSVRLRTRIAGRVDACHMPVRIAKRLLSDEDIQRYRRPA